MSSTLVQPYIFFGGRCEEALEFYRQSLDAEVQMVMKFSQSPHPTPPGMLAPGFENKVMHSSFRIGGPNGSVIMASDGCQPGQTYAGFSLAMSVATADEARKRFGALSAGGQVKMPLTKTFWSESYGMLTDKFGVEWMVMVTPSGS